MIHWDIFKELLEAPGAPGYEHEVRNIMRKHISLYTDEIIQDRLGGIFGINRGNDEGPKVMVAGHMDEVGFMVTKITPRGFLRFQILGGWWNQVLLAQQVDVVTRRGARIRGVIGSTPPHLLTEEQRKKPVDFSQMFIDIGADNEIEVRECGIEVGDFIVPFCPFQEMKGQKKLLSKAWDNRFGCGIAIELLSALKSISFENVVYSGATVQEEVGLRGAAVAANLIQPDMFFAVDTGPAGDTPGIEDGFGKIGKGVLIRIYDRSMIPLPTMRDFLLDTAESNKIPYQFFVSQGGTDAGQVHVSNIGIPSAAIGICARYIHSHASIVDREDIEATKEFIVALIKNIDNTTLKTILG